MSGPVTVEVPTYTAAIHCGLRPGYKAAHVLPSSAAKNIVKAYAEETGVGFAVVKARYVYRGGDEPGVIVSCTNYPHRPATRDDLRGHALSLAGRLMRGLAQSRVTVVLSDYTVTISEDL